MTPEQVKHYYGNAYRFKKLTSMSASTLANWIAWGYVPLLSQLKLQKLTKGELKADINGHL